MSRKFKLQTMILYVTLSFALGWFTPKAFDSWRSTEQSGPQQAASTAPDAAPSASGAAFDALSRFKAIEWSAEPLTGADELVPALASNPSLRTAALERFRQEPAGVAKNNLAQFLTAQPLPEIIAAATEWAQQADSASARTRGFELLVRMPPQPATYRLARQALDLEKDPQALGAAIWTLSPQGVLDPAEVGRVVPRLHALTQHPLSNIREASIQRIAEWDKAQLHVTQDVLRLLSDPDVEVRLAAIGATSIASLTANSIKQRLLALLVDAKESAGLRSIVALNLQRFALNADEYATYQAVQRDLFGNKEGK